MKKLLIALFVLFSINAHSAPLLREFPEMSHLRTKKTYTVQTLFTGPLVDYALSTAVETWNYYMGYELLKVNNNRGETADIYVNAVPLDISTLIGIAIPTSTTTCMVIVDERFAMFPAVFVHELGHCLGLAHDTNGRHIMNPVPDLYRWWLITPDQIETLKREQNAN